jgi:hypothetical protein
VEIPGKTTVSQRLQTIPPNPLSAEFSTFSTARQQKEMSTEKSAVIAFVLKAIVENGSDVADDEGAESIRANESHVFALLQNRNIIKEYF